MKLIVLSSGSKGNTTYIETKKAKILIDAGNSTKYIVNKLNEINVDIKDLDALLITHTHSDHIKGIKTLIKKSNLTVYISDLMHKELEYLTNYQIIDKEKAQQNMSDAKIIADELIPIPKEKRVEVVQNSFNGIEIMRIGQHRVVAYKGKAFQVKSTGEPKRIEDIYQPIDFEDLQNFLLSHAIYNKIMRENRQ